MGKGDIRSRKGKIWRGTYGKTRPQNKKRKPRTAIVSKKVKSLKDIKSVVAETPEVIKAAEPVVTAPVVEQVQQPVVEAAVPVTEPNVNAEAEAAPAEETKKAGVRKSGVKKAPAAKKAAPKKK